MLSPYIIPNEMNTRASITIFMSWRPKKLQKGVSALLELPIVPALLELLHIVLTLLSVNNNSRNHNQIWKSLMLSQLTEDHVMQFGEEDRTTKWRSLPKTFNNFVTLEIYFWNLKSCYVYIYIYIKMKLQLMKNDPGEGRSVILPSWSTI